MRSLFKDFIFSVQESINFIGIFALVSLAISLIILISELLFQISACTVGILAIKNLLLALISSFFFIIGFFIISWRPGVFGSEKNSITAVCLLWFAALFLINIFMMNRFGISFKITWFKAIREAAFMVLPFLLFSCYAYMLGSKWH